MCPVFLNPGRRDEWLKQIEAEDPTARAVLSVLREAAGREPEVPPDAAAPADFVCAHYLNRLFLAWLEDDVAASREARDELLGQIREATDSDLKKAARVQTAVQAWDFGAGLWPEAEKNAFAGELEGLARSFLDVGRDNPHNVTNNWWALTHGACLLACIAADGETGLDGVIDLSDLKSWALERVRAFCAVFGNAGLYHEGSGYIAYTLSMLLPALIAAERHLDPDILDEFPQFRKSIASMLVGTAAIAETDDTLTAKHFGSALQWNDAGRQCLSLNPFLPGMALAPEEWQGALRTCFDRLLGHAGRNIWSCPYRGMGFVLAFYPFATTPADPEGRLPKQVWDHRQGLGMWRSEWGTGAESVFGWYARSTHAGGHRHDDAASLRLIARGRTWICGGGQARGKAQWQSVFTHAQTEDRPKPAPLAHLTCSHLHEKGGVVGIDVRASLGAYGERYLSWRSDLEPDFALATLDLLEEHRDPPRDWQWTLSFPRGLEAEIHPDGAGFSLLDPERGRLTARFLIDCPDRIEVREVPESKRTYSSGPTITYPVDHYICAAYPARKTARILVGMAVGPFDSEGRDPEITLDRNTIAIDGKPWPQPFSPAILKTVDLAQSAPNRMTLPAG